MHNDDLTRREFTTLTMAALTGAVIGCGKAAEAPARHSLLWHEGRSPLHIASRPSYA